MNNTITLSIVMPCLNEARTLPICIAKAKDFIYRRNIKAEIIIADNGSTDGSQQIAMGLGVTVSITNEKGYGNALKLGIRQAKGKYVIMGDADDSYDFSDLDNFFDLLESGYDLVIGNRFRGGIAKGAMPFLHRYLGNPVLSFIGKSLFEVRINDFHCGLRAFPKSAIEQLDLQTSGMEFASEMIIKAQLLEMRIIETPTKLYVDGRNRPSHLNKWKDGWRHLMLLVSTFLKVKLLLFYQSKPQSERIDRLAKEISSYLENDNLSKQSLNCLDIGCGNMQLAERISIYQPHTKWACVDVFKPIPFFIRWQERQQNIDPQRWSKYMQFDGKMLPFADDTFDMVLFADVLHHCPENTLDLLKEAKRISSIVIIKDHLEYGFFSRQMLRLMDMFGNLGTDVYIPKQYFTLISFANICSKAGFESPQLRVGVDLYGHSYFLKKILKKKWQFIAIFKKECFNNHQK